MLTTMKKPPVLDALEYQRLKDHVVGIHKQLRAYEDAEERAKFKLLVGSAWSLGPDRHLLITELDADVCLRTLEVFDSTCSAPPKKKAKIVAFAQLPRVVIERGCKAYPPENEGYKKIPVARFWQRYLDSVRRLQHWHEDEK